MFLQVASLSIAKSLCYILCVNTNSVGRVLSLSCLHLCQCDAAGETGAGASRDERSIRCRAIAESKDNSGSCFSWR